MRGHKDAGEKTTMKVGSRLKRKSHVQTKHVLDYNNHHNHHHQQNQMTAATF